MDIQTTPHPLVKGVVDILIMVGKENYTVPAYIREAKSWGMSKRIPFQAVPEGIVEGVTRLFAWHAEAIPLVTGEGVTLKDLTAEMVRRGLMSYDAMAAADLDQEWSVETALLPDSYVPSSILDVTCALQDADPKVRHELTTLFGIVWQPGVIAYSPMGKLEYVVPKGQEDSDLPDEVARLGDLVEPVQVTYLHDGGEEEEDED